MTVPNFKDVVAADLAAFLNPEEFGELHMIDDKEILAVVDGDLQKGLPRQPMDLYNAASGVYLAEVTLFIRLADLGYKPVIGQRLELDGEVYPVTGCSESMGMLNVVLEVHRA